MKTRILLLVGLLLAGCSPKITTNMAETRAPLPEDALIVVLGLDDVVPAEAEYLGKIKIGDSGLTKTGEQIPRRRMCGARSIASRLTSSI